MPALSDLKVKLFGDGAELKIIAELNKNPWIKGFTTNPTLMPTDANSNNTPWRMFKNWLPCIHSETGGATVCI